MKPALVAGALAAVAIATVVAQGQSTVPPPTPPTTSQSTGARPAPPQAPKPGSIAPQADRLVAAVVGQVVDDTGRAVPKAVVRIIGHSVADSAVTDAKGRFLFKDLPAGEFVITATKTGFHSGGFGQRRPGGDPLPFFINPGQFISDMRVEIFRSAVITGMVVDEGSEPVIGARVVVFRRRFIDGDWRYQTAGTDTTDDQGAYRVHGLEPGEYIVSTPTASVTVPKAALAEIGQTGRVSAAMTAFWREAQVVTGGTMPATTADTADAYVVWNGLREPWTDAGPGLTYPTLFYPASRQPLLALAVGLTPGEVRYGVNFQWSSVPARTITGQLTGPAGSIADQFLRLIPVDNRESGIEGGASITISAPDGSFAFQRVPPGRYVLEAGNGIGAAVSSVIDLPQTDVPVPTMFWGRQDVFVSDEDVTDLRIDMRPGAAMAGVIATTASSATASSTAVPGTTMTGATTSVASSTSPTAEAKPATPSFPAIPLTLVPARPGLSPVATPRVLEDGRFTASNLTPGESLPARGRAASGLVSVVDHRGWRRCARSTD